jgi:hypothetical protein
MFVTSCQPEAEMGDATKIESLTERRESEVRDRIDVRRLIAMTRQKSK